jgi:predicted O-methyltransferase YrrM
MCYVGLVCRKYYHFNCGGIYLFKKDSALKNRLEQIHKMTESVPGWLTRLEGETLYELARYHAPVPTFVELGAWKGKSTIWLSKAVEDRREGRVFCVDMWNWTPNRGLHHENEVYDEFQANLSRHGIKHLVEPMRGKTVNVSRKWPYRNPIGLLFIDASHRYSSVREDFEFWSPFVSVGGYIAFHDVGTWPGPTQLVSELPGWCMKVETKGLWVCRKVMEERKTQ